MKFPLVLIPTLTDRQHDRYRRHMDSDRSGWHRKWTESIWRRHQHPSNRMLSGYLSEGDQRRRLIHFYDEYGVENGGFVLRHAYLWLNVTLPAPDVEEYEDAILEGIKRGEWRPVCCYASDRQWRRGDLLARLTLRRLHPEDERRNHTFPPSYRNLEIVVWTAGYELPDGIAERPWRWFHEVGLRPMLTRGLPQTIEPEEIAAYLPAQVELGCGPSTEAGVPPLSTLHRIYGVSRPDFSFVFHAEDDAMLELFADPEPKYREMADIYRACMIAQSTPFYASLRDLWTRGFFVGPIITNNFDCLCADLELKETSLRRYDTEPYFPMTYPGEFPTVEWDPRARSLLVIGVHADRRLAQTRAREHGLKVIYIDPERYVAPDGRRIDYPVEAPQDNDLFVRSTAGEALPRLQRFIERRSQP
jgi:hypothetical protein